MPAIASVPGLPEKYTQQFFPGDVVTQKINNVYRGRVVRVWTEDDDAHLRGTGHPLDRSLLRGEVGIMAIETGRPIIIPESHLVLLSREFIKGDIVKRSFTSIESAVVIDTGTQLLLEHAVSGEKIADWIGLEETVPGVMFDARERVVYDEWIGTIEEVLEDSMIESRSGRSYKLAEMGGLLQPGRLVSDLIPKDPMFQHALEQLPPHADPKTDRVITVTPVVVYISWNAINQQLPISEQIEHPEPPKFWYGDDLKKLTLFENMYREPPPVGSIVELKDEATDKKYGVRPTMHYHRTVKSRSLQVMQTRSRVRLLWQDGRQTEEWATDLLPYHNLDDYETWPGEHIMWRGDDNERRPGVIQSYNARQRTAEIFFPDSKEIQTVSVLELDSGPAPSNYGVGVGQDVLLCPDNGVPYPQVPTIGQFDTPADSLNWRSTLSSLAEQYVRDSKKFQPAKPQGKPTDVAWWGEVKALRLNGQVDVLLPNGELKTVSTRQLQLLNEPGQMMGGESDDGVMMIDEDGYGYGSDASWETTSMEERSFANGYTAFDDENYPSRFTDRSIYRRNNSDGEGQGEEDFVDADMLSEEGRDIEEVDPLVSPPKKSKPIRMGSPPPYRQPRNRDVYSMPTPAPLPLPTVSITTSKSVVPLWAPAPRSAPIRITPPPTKGKIQQGSDVLMSSPGSGPSRLVNGHANGHSTIGDTNGGTTNGDNNGYSVNGHSQSLEGDERWQSFEILEEAPVDHYFYSKPSMTTGQRSFHSRIQKEHKTLMSSVPENILVRTFGNRTDLMRVLIIGPEGTPYANAPFMFDVYLPPDTFPREPPVVHFHSHTNGKGRCNPNLYEEGKVCLSVLGTWAGDKTESWNEKTSSLLQVFVSISGLVLVRSPYHCEPAFAKLEGTREGKINSRLYSEKAYVLSRSFVRQALDRPPSTFESELKYYYLNHGKLREVISHARALMDKEPEKSLEMDAEAGFQAEAEEDPGMWNADAVGSLTVGAILSLKRPIEGLEKILRAHEASSAAVSS